MDFPTNNNIFDMSKSARKNLIVIVLILVIVGGLVYWATKFLQFDGSLMPKDIYMQGKDTTYSAPMGGFIIITVGTAFAIWLISFVIGAIGKWKEKREEEREKREKKF